MLSGPEHPGLKSEAWATHSKSGGCSVHAVSTPKRRRQKLSCLEAFVGGGAVNRRHLRLQQTQVDGELTSMVG